MTPLAGAALSGALGVALLAAGPCSGSPTTCSDPVASRAAAAAEPVHSLVQKKAVRYASPNKSIPILGQTDTAVQADSLLNDLWDGLDLSAEENSLIEENLWSGGQTLMQERARMPKDVSPMRVLGLFDSGTNLLCLMLQLNFGFLGCKDQKIWKHTVVTNHGQEAGHVENFVKAQQGAGGLVVALVRNPIAHMAAWRKAPYDLAECFSSLNWNQHALQGQCSFAAKSARKVPWRQVYPEPGLAGVWNAQTEGYVELAKRHANMIVVKYEDLVLCPHNTLRRIAEVANATHLLADEIVVPEAPAKNHGHPNGREAAVTKIKASLYLEREGVYLQDQLREVCSALDLVAAESDSSCSETPAYDVDCRDFQ